MLERLQQRLLLHDLPLPAHMLPPAKALLPHVQKPAAKHAPLQKPVAALAPDIDRSSERHGHTPASATPLVVDLAQHVQEALVSNLDFGPQLLRRRRGPLQALLRRLRRPGRAHLRAVLRPGLERGRRRWPQVLLGEAEVIVSGAPRRGGGTGAGAGASPELQALRAVDPGVRGRGRVRGEALGAEVRCIQGVHAVVRLSARAMRRDLVLMAEASRQGTRSAFGPGERLRGCSLLAHSLQIVVALGDRSDGLAAACFQLQSGTPGFVQLALGRLRPGLGLVCPPPLRRQLFPNGLQVSTRPPGILELLPSRPRAALNARRRRGDRGELRLQCLHQRLCNVELPPQRLRALAGAALGGLHICEIRSQRINLSSHARLLAPPTQLGPRPRPEPAT
mmetsp:Transcript_37988/g.108941  ORF Transcript_37988/g.108941 Transcript_37988/m.108941 type:complete len:393 (-) Transcript_37988:389-1567(-)